MAIVLGKDATLSVGDAITGVTNVTWTETARTIDIDEYGSRYKSVYQTGFEAMVSFEVNDNTSMGAIFTALQNGSEVTVSGNGGASWSFPAVLTSISESQTLDGVATFSVEARITRSGLRV